MLQKLLGSVRALRLLCERPLPCLPPACRLTFWWSNVLQLRWMFWALAQGPLGLDAPPGAAGAALQELARQGSEQALSPRALAAASKHGLDWMQVWTRPLPCLPRCGSLCCGRLRWPCRLTSPFAPSAFPASSCCLSCVIWRGGCLQRCSGTCGGRCCCRRSWRCCCPATARAHRRRRQPRQARWPTERHGRRSRRLSLRA